MFWVPQSGQCVGQTRHLDFHQCLSFPRTSVRMPHLIVEMRMAAADPGSSKLPARSRFGFSDVGFGGPQWGSTLEMSVPPWRDRCLTQQRSRLPRK